MRRSVVVLALALACAALALACSHERPFRFATQLDDEHAIHYDLDIDTFTLANGLRVVLAPAPGTNLVAVDVRYPVGAADEPAGQRGLAHLVEHLTFAGRTPGGARVDSRLSGSALSFNGFTTADGTHYTEIALSPQWPELLAIEAARMGLTCDAIEPAGFDHERGVVAQELAERNTAALDPLLAAVFGPDHPYGHSPGGTDLARLSFTDACGFLTAHYAPDRAILVVSGAFDRAQLRDAITALFGGLTRRSAAPKAVVPLDALPGPDRVELVTSLDAPVVAFAYPAPAWGSDDAIYHLVAERMIADALDALDRDRADVTATDVRHIGGARGGATLVSLTLTPHADVAAVAAAARAKLAKLDAPSAIYVALLRGYVYAALLRRYDDVGERGDMIADYLQLTDTTDLHLHDLEVARDLTSDAVNKYAQRAFVHMHPVELHLTPDPKRARSTSLRALAPPTTTDLPPSSFDVELAEADRALVPPPAAPTPYEELHLDNGLRVLLAREPSSALFEARMVFPAGRADEPAGAPGTAELAASQLEYDYERVMTPAAVRAIYTGWQTGTSRGEDVSAHATVFSTSGIASFAAWHLWWLHVRLEGGRYHKDALARAEADDDDDEADARTAIFGRLLGPASALARPRAPHGLRAGDLDRFRDAHYTVDGATLIVTGNFDRAAIEQEIRDLWGAWPRRPRAGAIASTPAAPAAGPTVFVRDDDDAPQLRLRVLFLARSDVARTPTRMVAEDLLDRELAAIRDQLAASYGVTARYLSTGEGDVVEIDGDLGAARARDALVRVEEILANVHAHAEADRVGFIRARRAALQLALARAGSAPALADGAEELAVHALPLDFFARLPAQVAAVMPRDVGELLRADLDPSRMVVVLIGPRAHEVAAAAGLAPITALPAKKPKEPKEPKESKDPKK